MASAPTYEHIATYTVTGSNLAGETGVTFSSIPQTYTDLIIVQNTKLTGAAIACIRIGNGGTINTSALYSQTSFSANAASAQSGRYADQTLWISVLAHSTSDWGSYITNMPNYTSTTSIKSGLSRFDHPTYGATEIISQTCRTTNAITSLKLFLDRAESYVVGSTFTLYGIKEA